MIRAWVKYSVTHRVTMGMVVIGLIMLAVISVMRLPLELFPKFETPHLFVNVPFSTSSPEELEERVAQPLEDALSSMRGLEKMTTRVERSGVNIDLEFRYGENMDYATSNARDAIDRIQQELPERR